MGDLSATEALSGALGSVSLASWILVLAPQLIENYRTKNAQGISLAFLAVWFMGDLTNVVGAIWAELVPTVVALAFYFCFADAVLVLQCLYYNHYYTRDIPLPPLAQVDASDDPRRPLLSQQERNLDLLGSRRHSSATSQPQPVSEPEADLLLGSINKNGNSRPLLTNIATIVGVCVVGVVGWAIAWRIGLWAPVHDDGNLEAARGPIGAEILGYVSALCYLGARIPQILKNYREKSCEGLSLLFFILSLLGNATYGGGIIFHSIRGDYLLTNLPWLVGSLGTMGEDALIFVQFRIYGSPDRSDDF